MAVNAKIAMYLTLAAALVLLLLPSCITSNHLIATPHLEKDFTLPSSEMSRIFWDVDRYEQVTFPFLAFFEMPPLSEVKYGNRFGYPDEKRLSWWNLCPFFMVPPLSVGVRDYFSFLMTNSL